MTSRARMDKAIRDIKGGMDDAVVKQLYGLNPATIKAIRDQIDRESKARASSVKPRDVL